MGPTQKSKAKIIKETINTDIITTAFIILSFI